ncbi:hypothetical protein Fsol_00494 [Candidatus Fokinia solitaria]|uniref:Uncharacterized protein n=1 Tax=Candidatus Fokinia solitaria TaxID=1802984 RepID=A0A2U8BSL1_9RICK|nr:hypothetical protein [Candidatus Fokinia solitaria]AWD33288.1 hypothetical protein Fsol_00494 [Candidatus Fokinia solitaria]
MLDNKNLSSIRTNLYALSKIDTMMLYCDASIMANVIVARYREFGYSIALHKLGVADSYTKVCGRSLREFISDLQISDEMWNSAAKLTGTTILKEAVLLEIKKLFETIYCGNVSLQMTHILNQNAVRFLTKEIEKTCGIYKLRTKSFHLLNELERISIDSQTDSQISYFCSFQNKRMTILLHDSSIPARWNVSEVLLIADGDASLQISQLRNEMLRAQVPLLVTSMKTAPLDQDAALWSIALAISYSFHFCIPSVVIVRNATLQQIALMLKDFVAKFEINDK